MQRGSSWERVYRRRLGNFTDYHLLRVKTPQDIPDPSDLPAGHIVDDARTGRNWIPGCTLVMVRRSLEGKDARKAWHALHAESPSANARSPGRAYRRARQVQHRRHAARELHRYMRGADYEPMVRVNPLSCQWDWS